MRRVVLALSALLLPWGLVFSQNPPPPPVAAPTPDADLDTFLRNWEQKMVEVTTLAAQLNRVDKDTTFNTTRKYSGFAQYMKVGSGPRAANMAMLEMRPDGRNEIAEKIIITGTYLYQYSPATKEINVHTLPQPKPGQLAEDNLTTLLFGVKAEEARRRYDLKLTNQDQYYLYITVTPRNPQDKADFQRARLVLNKGTFLPRQLWFEQPNGSEVTWDIPAIRAGVDLRRDQFDAPTPPPGWKMVQVPRNADTQPRMINQGPR
jgi:TIGR03009 family protein